MNLRIGNVAYLFELLHQGIVDLAVHRRENTLLSNSSVKHLLDRNSTWDTNYVPLFNYSISVIGFQGANTYQV